MIGKIQKFYREFDVEENIHWIIMGLAVLGICFALYGKYKAQEFIKNDPNTKYILQDSTEIQKDTQ